MTTVNGNPLAASARSGDAQSQFQLSQQCFAEKRYEEMVEWLGRAANQGFAPAQDALGYVYEKALGVERDYDAALRNYRKASKNGSVQAGYRLATLRYKSKDGRRHHAAIRKHLEQACQAGHREATRVLGYLLLQSEAEQGVGLKLLTTLASAGDLLASLFVGLCYHAGQGTAPDDARARHFFTQAADGGLPMARELLEHGAPEPDNCFGDSVRGDVLKAGISRTLRWRELSDDPVVHVAEAALPAADRFYLIAFATPLMRPANVINPGRSGETMRSVVRTNASAFIQFPIADIVTHYIEQRICATVGESLERSEPLSMLEYQPGQFYKPHYDFFDPELNVAERLMRIAGQRTASAVCYLNTVPEGGATAFPELGLSVPAVGGDLVYFHNCRADGSPEPRSLHSGENVVKGVKWATTKWFRQRPTSYLEI